MLLRHLHKVSPSGRGPKKGETRVLQVNRLDPAREGHPGGDCGEDPRAILPKQLLATGYQSRYRPIWLYSIAAVPDNSCPCD